MRRYDIAPCSRIIVSSCQHIGNAGAREDKFGALMDKAASKNIPVVLLGDAIEAISPIDVRFVQETHKDSVTTQSSRFAELIRPARKQLVTLLIGNHEDKLNRVVGNVTDQILEMAYGRKVPAKNGTGAAYIGVGKLILFVAHSKVGFGRGTSDPDRDNVNRQVRLRRYLAPWKADVKIVGHAHQVLIAPPVTVDKLESDMAGEYMRPAVHAPEWCAVCPSFFASYDRNSTYPSYAELSLYVPNTIGHLELVMDAKRGKVVDIESHIIH